MLEELYIWPFYIYMCEHAFMGKSNGFSNGFSDGVIITLDDKVAEFACYQEFADV